MITTSSLQYLGIILGLASLPVRSHVIPSRQHDHHTHGACSQVTSILESFQQATVCSDHPAVKGEYKVENNNFLCIHYKLLSDEFVQPTLEILITKKCYNNLKFDGPCLQDTYDVREI